MSLSFCFWLGDVVRARGAVTFSIGCTYCTAFLEKLESGAEPEPEPEPEPNHEIHSSYTHITYHTTPSPHPHPPIPHPQTPKSQTLTPKPRAHSPLTPAPTPNTLPPLHHDYRAPSPLTANHDKTVAHRTSPACHRPSVSGSQNAVLVTAG